MIRTTTVVLALVVSGCATSYQPEGFSGGYSEMQSAKNTWLVSFRGNGYTREARSSDFALLRGCELILESGCTHYRLLDAQSGTTFGGVFLNANVATAINKPKAQIAIECASPDVGIDAAATAARLRAKYSLDE